MPETEVTIDVGGTVTWLWTDDYTHGVQGIDSAYDLFEGPGGASDPLNGQGSTFSYTFTTAGDFPFDCVIHEFMQGVVHVVQPAVSTPPPPPPSPPPSPPPGPVCAKGSGFWGVNCTACGCAFGAPCSDGNAGTGCECPPFTSGSQCATCFPNRSPLYECKKVIDPCIRCPTSDPSNCTNSRICPLHAGCYTNGNVGNYKCKCYAGYTTVKSGTTFKCADKNECATPAKACPVWYKTCTNKIGSYNCTCQTGRVPIYNSARIPRYCVKSSQSASFAAVNGKLKPQLEVTPLKV